MNCPYCNEEILLVVKKAASGKKAVEGKFFCSECNKEIPTHVKAWSETNLGVALCYNCQKIAKEKQ